MSKRQPVVAGQFYGGTPKACTEEIQQCLDKARIEADLPDSIVAGIVPHAGWLFSGDLAAMVFQSIQSLHPDVDTFVIFGAVHSHSDSTCPVYSTDPWATPIGDVEIDQELAKDIIEKCSAAEANDIAHRMEHSIEVQVPFIKYLFPNAKIVPIMTPPVAATTDLGKCVGKIIASETDKKVICLGSTDLTHYGPRYGFVPEGTGQDGIKWAKEINDVRFLDMVLRLEAKELLECSLTCGSACGPGAVAATVSAAKAAGKTHGTLLAHTTSSDILEEKFQQSSEESVGYTAIVF